MKTNDGRSARSIATRAALLAATREAMRAGCWRPNAQTVALLASRSLRSVFQHFPTIEALHKEAISDRSTAQEIVAQIDSLRPDDRLAAMIAGEHPLWIVSDVANRVRENRR